MQNYICIDLGGTNIRVAIINEKLKILEIKKEKSIHDDAMLLYAQIKKMILSFDLTTYKPLCIGVSTCGVEREGNIVYSPNLNINDLNLKALLEKDFKLETKVVNDANAAALSEAKFGTFKDNATVFFATISSGLGVGLVYKGNLINLPLEAGHQIITYKSVDYDIEHLLSGNGLVRLAQINGLNITSASDFFALYQKGNTLSKIVLDDYTSLLAKFFYNQQICYDVDYIILSGGMMKSKDFFMQDVENKTNLLLNKMPMKKIKFVLSKFDQDACLYGALAVCMFF